MTGVALVMRRDTGWNGQRRGATAQPAVTRGTSGRRAARTGVVLNMIEFHVEGFVEPARKSFQRWVGSVEVRMADRAHGNIRGQQLGLVAIEAGFVSRKPRSGGVVSGPRMTSGARKRSVTLAGMFES
ncbi:MAG TPA: hypothetical protein VMS31_14700 [Pyrinomonadaceae bacterium]|nr:hypothetical protein [Pyrinomonadaceae bacterium]